MPTDITYGVLMGGKRSFQPVEYQVWRKTPPVLLCFIFFPLIAIHCYVMSLKYVQIFSPTGKWRSPSELLDGSHGVILTVSGMKNSFINMRPVHVYHIRHLTSHCKHKHTHCTVLCTTKSEYWMVTSCRRHCKNRVVPQCNSKTQLPDPTATSQKPKREHLEQQNTILSL